jgi:hypothetical protein
LNIYIVASRSRETFYYLECIYVYKIYIIIGLEYINVYFCVISVFWFGGLETKVKSTYMTYIHTYMGALVGRWVFLFLFYCCTSLAALYFGKTPARCALGVTLKNYDRNT